MTERKNHDSSGQHRLAMEELGKLWDEGIASGPAEDGEEVFKELRRELAEIFPLAKAPEFRLKVRSAYTRPINM